MQKYRNVIFVVVSFIFCLSLSAQTSRFDEKVDLGNGLFKVKSNNRWGLVDKDDNLKLSVEYNEPLFMNGKAVLSKYGSQQIAGIVDSIGNIFNMPPLFLNMEYPIITDGMLAVKETQTGKWGFLNIDTGKMLSVNIKGFKPGKSRALKTLGINGKSVKGSFVFDFVAPFVEGLAAVYTENTGWHHIDRNGNERLKNPNLHPSLLRTSIHNGEAVIFDDRGIILCMEDPSGFAGIKQYVAEEFEIKKYNDRLNYSDTINTYGSKLILNNKFQADKYEDGRSRDSIIFIERPVVIQKNQPIEEPKDSFILNRDISIVLSQKVVSAGAKGTAVVTVNVSNIGEFESGNISFTVNINGKKKSWEGVIGVGTTRQISVVVPAKFSASSITRDVEWTAESKEEKLTGRDKVSIRRYKPSRR